jgi:hypothetical protein
MTATRDGQVVAATSTDTNGAYRLRIQHGEFLISAELAAFARFEQTQAVSPDTCDVPLDVQLVLASRVQAGSGQQSGPVIEAPASLRRPNRLASTRGQQEGQERFSQLQLVQSSAASAAGNSSTLIDDADPATRLLPPGFSTEAATSVVAVTGEVVSVDRGQLRDRLAALGRGEFAAAGAQPPEGFGPRFGGPGGAPAFAEAQAGFGGPGSFGPGPQSGPGGFAGRGGGFPGRGRGGNTLPGIGKLQLRRLGAGRVAVSDSCQLANRSNLRAPAVRRDSRRPVAHTRRLRRIAHDVLRELLGRSLEQPRRRVRDGAERGDACW